MTERPDLKAALGNLRSGKGLLATLRQAMRNTWIKLRTGSSCCGHPGEPGC